MEWLSYLLKVSTCMAFFYAFYHVALRKLSFFSFNRYYLLSSLVISFLIPALQVKIERQVKLQQHVNSIEHPINIDYSSTTVSAIQQSVGNSSPYSWMDFLVWAYWLIAICCLVVLSYRMTQLAMQFGKASNQSGQLKIVYKSTGFTNCSFLNYVFVDQQNLSSDELEVILQHERVHAIKLHSLDKLFIQFSQVMLWFNPFIYLYGKALEEMHEYEADRETSNLVGSTLYAKILLAIAIQKNHPPLLHGFVKNQVKARINMLFTNQSKNMKKLMYLFSLPLGLGLVSLFGVEMIYAKPVTTLSKPVKTARTEDKQEGEIQQVKPPAKPEKAVPSLVVQSEQAQDTLRMVGRDMGPNPTVTIDGKDYPAEILTRISPRCIYTTSGSSNSITITTHGNKIEYATKTDIENVRTEISAEKSTTPYIRYTLKNEDGEKFDRVKVRTKRGSASLDLPKDAKVLILIEGKMHQEKDATKLSAEDFEGLTTVTASSSMDNYAQYGKEYQGVFDIKKENQ